MARTRKSTPNVEEPKRVVVELQSGIQEQEPVEQADEAAQAVTTDEQPEPQLRSRGCSLNEVRLIGRVAKEATVRVTTGGITVGYLRIVTNGVRESDTGFHQLTVFGKTAEFAGNHLDTGRLVYVEGQLQTRPWIDQQGIRRWTTTIVVHRLQALDSRRTAVDAEPAAQ